MNNQELSDWSAHGEKPPCVGVWETDYQPSWPYQYFDGINFRCAEKTPHLAFVARSYKSICDQSKVRFRGLVEKPE